MSGERQVEEIQERMVGGGVERLTGQESPLCIQAALNEFSQVFG